MRAFALALCAALAGLAPAAVAEPCAQVHGLATACIIQSSTQTGPHTVTQAGASLATPLADGITARAYSGCASDGQGAGCDYATHGAALAVGLADLDARVEHNDTPFGESVCVSPQPGEGTCIGLPLP